ncbi:MAG: class I SAM-dependent methyltransferase [Actinobacteria bacterium]|nr:class I SAM-dependent methyltransferase [Actinomycetota bacterium]
MSGALAVMDWVAWHEAYDDGDSSLARRLDLVQRRLGELIQGASPRRRVLSLCAGDGRDVIPVLARAASPPAALLVENDETLARRARESALAAGLEALEVRCADAGDPASFEQVLPADILLLCGIFGNIEHNSVKEVIDILPRLLAAGGHVIWTRGGSEPDRRPEIRGWFPQAGLREIAFDGAPEPYGVGVNRLAAGAVYGARPLPQRVFTFP